MEHAPDRFGECHDRFRCTHGRRLCSLADCGLGIGLVLQAEAVSSKRLDDVGDFRRHGYNLRVVCQSCGRVAVIDPTELVLLCNRNGWSRQMASVEKRLRCSKCGSRDVRCGPGFAT